jgi:hypothetical protein
VGLIEFNDINMKEKFILTLLAIAAVAQPPNSVTNLDQREATQPKDSRGGPKLCSEADCAAGIFKKDCVCQKRFVCPETPCPRGG